MGSDAGAVRSGWHRQEADTPSVALGRDELDAFGARWREHVGGEERTCQDPFAHQPVPKGPNRSRRRGNRVEGAKRARGGWGLLQERQPLTHNCLGKRAGVLDLVVGLQIRAELT